MTQEQYCKKSPCKSCPYRKDAPLAYWHEKYFEGLLIDEIPPKIGQVYDCHLNDGKKCTGWLMEQNSRNIENVHLRISLMKHNIPNAFLDSLTSPVELYESVFEMVKAHFPELYEKYSIETDKFTRQHYIKPLT